MKILVVVDMQNDFVTGSLGTAEAQAILPAVVEKIRDAAKDEAAFVFVTRDTHGLEYLDTAEGKHLPVVHCVRGSDGWQLAPDVAAALEAVPAGRLQLVDKPTFGCAGLPDAVAAVCGGAPENIELVGLCTGICVLSNAMLLKARFYETPIAVDAACCACVTPQSHRTALAAMQLCQIEIKNG